MYLDTSALVKLYVYEEGSDLVHRAVKDTWRTRASELAYTEARSAFARKHREGALDDEYLGLVVGWLDEDWEHFSYDPIVPDAELCRRAGGLAEKHSLRALDALQLASALRLRESRRQDPAGDIVFVLTFDEGLRRATAAEERLRLYEPPPADASDAGEPGGEQTTTS